MKKAVITSVIIAIIGLLIAVAILFILQSFGYDNAITVSFITGIFSLAVAFINAIVVSNKKSNNSYPNVGATVKGEGHQVGKVEVESDGDLKVNVGPDVSGKDNVVEGTKYEQK